MRLCHRDLKYMRFTTRSLIFASFTSPRIFCITSQCKFIQVRNKSPPNFKGLCKIPLSRQILADVCCNSKIHSLPYINILTIQEMSLRPQPDWEKTGNNKNHTLSYDSLKPERPLNRKQNNNHQGANLHHCKELNYLFL